MLKRVVSLYKSAVYPSGMFSHFCNFAFLVSEKGVEWLLLAGTAYTVNTFEVDAFKRLTGCRLYNKNDDREKAVNP